MSRTSYKGKDTWILILILAIFVMIDGIAFLLLSAGIERNVVIRVTGNSWEQISSAFPGVANYITYLTLVVGLTLLGLSIMMIATGLTGYRTGKRWAWYLSWYLPFYFLLSGIITLREGANISLEEYTAAIIFAFFVLSMIAQIASIRWFFSRDSGIST